MPTNSAMVKPAGCSVTVGVASLHLTDPVERYALSAVCILRTWVESKDV